MSRSIAMSIMARTIASASSVRVYTRLLARGQRARRPQCLDSFPDHPNGRARILKRINDRANAGGVVQVRPKGMISHRPRLTDTPHVGNHPLPTWAVSASSRIGSARGGDVLRDH